MRPIEFCYWLMGMFELNAPEALDAEQVSCIRRHIKLASATPDKEDIGGEPIRFLGWLEGALDVGANSKEATGTIRTRLEMLFERSIDPKYPNSAELSQIHNPVSFKPGARC